MLQSAHDTPSGGRTCSRAKAASAAAFSSVSHPAWRRGCSLGTRFSCKLARSSRWRHAMTSACSACRISWPCMRTRLEIVVSKSSSSSWACQGSRCATETKGTSCGGYHLSEAGPFLETVRDDDAVMREKDRVARDHMTLCRRMGKNLARGRERPEALATVTGS